jgi:hypothetical protein
MPDQEANIYESTLIPFDQPNYGSTQRGGVYGDSVSELQEVCGTFVEDGRGSAARRNVRDCLIDSN